MIHPLEVLTEQPLGEGEYKKDGIVCCTDCYTPRQRLLKRGERSFWVWCVCAGARRKSGRQRKRQPDSGSLGPGGG